MKTELLDATKDHDNTYQQTIARAAELLTCGQLVAFPTDTVYGVAAVGSLPSAVAQLYVAKGRPPDKAIPILLADIDDLAKVVSEISDLVRRLVDQFWPGGLTLVLPKSNLVPSEVSPTLNVAVRLPDLDLTRQIIAAVGTPLAVTSANRSGQSNPCTASEVMDQLSRRIAAVVDGGTCPGGVPSTILDCTTDHPKLVRAGAIPVEALRRITELA